MDRIELRIQKKNDLDLTVKQDKNILLGFNSKSVSSYDALTNKPSINGTTVQGDKLGIDYRLQDKMDTLTIQEIEKILYVGA